VDIDTLAGCQHIWNLIPLENVDYFVPQQFIEGDVKSSKHTQFRGALETSMKFETWSDIVGSFMATTWPQLSHLKLRGDKKIETKIERGREREGVESCLI